MRRPVTTAPGSAAVPLDDLLARLCWSAVSIWQTGVGAICWFHAKR